MEKREQLYEGKAKKVFATDDPNMVIVSYKDDATAFNGQKKGTIDGKGSINNRMSNLVKKVEIVPLEVIVRNVGAGSFAKRMGIEEGRTLKCPTVEFSYKNDALGDPFINHWYALALNLATEEEIEKITETAFAVNEVLRNFFAAAGIELIDFKLEFGRFDGKILLADEISPDTCRLWDSKTKEKLDKDRFRRDMGGAEEAYQEVFSRIGLF